MIFYACTFCAHSFHFLCNIFIVHLHLDLYSVCTCSKCCSCDKHKKTVRLYRLVEEKIRTCSFKVNRETCSHNFFCVLVTLNTPFLTKSIVTEGRIWRCPINGGTPIKGANCTVSSFGLPPSPKITLVN